MTPYRHVRIPVHGIHLHAVEVGAVGAPLMLFLHGFPERWSSWRPMLDAFSASHFCVAIDNRGFGASDRPPHVDDYAIEKIVSDIRAVATHYRAQTMTLVGHDWGGIAAWYFANAFPDLLDGLVIINAPHPMLFQRALLGNAAQRAASQYFNRFRDAGAEARITEMGIENFWDSLFTGHMRCGAILDEDRSAQLAEWREAGALTAMLNWYRASNVIVPAIGDPLTEAPLALQKTDVKTLVVWGMQDQLLLSCLLDDLYVVAPRSTTVRIESAGHGVLHEAPKQVVDAIRIWKAKA